MPEPSKRSRPLNHEDPSGPHIKRAKFTRRESIESEDELSRGPVATPKKITNFSALRSPNPLFSRGDIQPTQFTGPVGTHLMTASTNRASIPDISVRRAASGKHVYFGDDCRGQLVLHQDGNSAFLVPRFPTDENPPLQWMRFSLDSINRLEHSASKNHYVRILRPRGNQFESNLWMEFTDHRDIFRLVREAKHTDAVFCDPENLQRRWKRAWDMATVYAAGNSKLITNSNALSSIKSPQRATESTRLIETRKEPVRGPRQEKIVSRLRNSTNGEQSRAGNASKDDDLTMSLAPTTRRTRRTSPVYVAREPSLDHQWTAQNPDWRKRWHTSLVFPHAGKNRATVDDDDIPRLDEGEFLNDNLISFYVRYLQFKLESDRPDLLNKAYIFNTFFFEKLRSIRGKVNYEGVKAWTAKFDLLSYDYIVVPVNENAHWYLAIICNTPNAITGMPDDEKSLSREDTASPGITMIARDMSDASLHGDDAIELHTKESSGSEPSTSLKTLQGLSPCRKTAAAKSVVAAPHVDPRLPKIVTLDSLGSSHPATCRVLKEYLMEEAKDKKGVDLAMIPTGMTAKKIPEQDNFCDCGVFILGYMKEFLKDPQETVRKLLQKEPVNWDIRPSLLREQVRDLLFQLQEEQQERLEKEKAEKQMLSAKKKMKKAAAARAAGQLASSPTTVREKLSRQQAGTVSSSATIPGTLTPVRSCEADHDATTSSPTKRLSVDDSQVKLVNDPRDKSSACNTQPDDELYSAPSLPTHEPVANGAPGKTSPKAKEQADRQIAKPSQKTLDTYLTRTLPRSSGIEVERKVTTPKRRKGASLESANADDVVFISPSPKKATRQESKQLGSSPTFVQLLRSSESPSPKESMAGYDGIERSVDLT
ncbi:Ulp1 protease family protein [Metarhizium rileyi]|uniref:Ulp1 protease family protein n=1 Tax=Metarhizium rileyi (strain RCEF 4871) TaxID=1649241 RepID=A0A167BFP2_METRR|nr:Ulp1 protease family protein [Metarhizium rileyi RCEF 4871]